MEYQYAKKFFVGYSDVDVNNHCKLSKIVDLLQNAATLHSDTLGFGAKVMMQRKQVWLMLGWHVRILQYPESDTDVEVRTWCRNIKGVEAKRGFEIVNEAGDTLILADSSWALYDLETQKLLRVPEEMLQAYTGMDRDPFEGEPKERLRDNDVVETEFQMRVGKRDIDTNHHMNNGKYMEVIMEVLPEDQKITEFVSSYRKQMTYGEEIQVSYGEGICRIKNEKGETTFLLQVK